MIVVLLILIIVVTAAQHESRNVQATLSVSRRTLDDLTIEKEIVTKRADDTDRIYKKLIDEKKDRGKEVRELQV
jgi:hypothetical protein